MPKRKRVSSARAVRTSMRVGNWGSLARASRVARPRQAPLRGRLSLSYMNQRIQGLSRMIETKESEIKTATNVALPHNNVTIIQSAAGGDLNIFQTIQGVDDPMGTTGRRIGDQISVRGVLLTGFLENALNRPRVHYRIMVVRCAKGDIPNRANLYRGAANNKMIDQFNTERFTIIASTKFTMSASNNIAGGVNAAGEPQYFTGAGIATKVFKLWIPGSRFGRNGVVQYENGSTVQVKFFDYRICIVAYDWFGTPQDLNVVGRVNEMYTKLYYKDA